MKKTLALIAVLALASIALSAQYSLTVNKIASSTAERAAELAADERRLRSTRYSKLTQINRDNVKNLRMVWALALGGMQDVGQNGPENEVNPLIDNGFMYTATAGARSTRSTRATRIARVRVGGRSRRAARGQRAATRGIALWEDKVVANLPTAASSHQPRQREIVWDKKIAGKNEFGARRSS
jgi:glucose dehydrogenase